MQLRITGKEKMTAGRVKCMRSELTSISNTFSTQFEFQTDVWSECVLNPNKGSDFRQFCVISEIQRHLKLDFKHLLFSFVAPVSLILKARINLTPGGGTAVLGFGCWFAG